ncbi:MAG: GNAT family N-acetyltransferase [Janthinobacterium lividum]
MLLRPLAAGDAETLASWEADEVFCAHAGWAPHASEQVAIAWWQNQITVPDPRLLRLLALHDESAVGYIDLYGGESHVRELGYVIAPAREWGRGLGTAAARAGLAYGFHTLGLRRVWAEAVEANTASVRVLHRLGMRQIGVGEAEDFLGRTSRYMQFEMLRNEWLAGLGQDQAAR